MDTVVPSSRVRGARALIIALLAAAFLIGLWLLLPRGLQVPAHELQITSVERGVYRDELLVRAQAEALHAVVLDAVESGRVEEVLVRDGAQVAAGQLLFRLSNPQRKLELLARQAEHAQQISNLANLRLLQEAGRTDHQRRLDDLAFALSQQEKQDARSRRLAQQGYISAAALEESADRLEQQRHVLAQEQASADKEARVRQDALAQMETAIDGLRSGLALVTASVDALAVRAPVGGRLTGFALQVGETVRIDQHIGRIDDPQHAKLTALVDEFYRNRIAVGRHGTAERDGQSWPVTVQAINPQISEGRFTVELAFTEGQPAWSPGQAVDVRITLGEPAPALLLPAGAFAGDTGGAWVFVVTPDGHQAERRAVRLGRRNARQIEVLSGLAQGEKVIVSSYAPFGKAERLQLSN